MSLPVQFLVDMFSEKPVLRGMSAMVGIKVDKKIRKILDMVFPHPVNQFPGFNALLAGLEHDWGAVGIVSADIDTGISHHFLKSAPDFRLQIFNQMPNVNRPVGVRQGTGYQNFSFSFAHFSIITKNRIVG
jgi:hypothetical protein